MTHTEFTRNLEGMRGELRTFTHRFTSNREVSQDLVQETMLKALLYRDKYRTDTNLKGWLFTIMRNTYINQYRRLQRARTFTDTTANLHFLQVEDEHTFHRPESSAEYKEVWNRVNSLRDELLIPFKLHTSGYKYHEIAEHLNLPIGTVKNRIFHARKEIQKKLTGYR